VKIVVGKVLGLAVAEIDEPATQASGWRAA
jgi:hypothetical protein